MLNNRIISLDKRFRRICKRGHDTHITGRDRLNGGCTVCQRQSHQLRSRIYKTENAAYAKKWKASRPNDVKLYSLRARCKAACTTLEHYISLPKKCSFPHCAAVKPGGNGDWQLDHNHITNEFRGLLCHKHNRQVSDLDISTALLVVRYLQTHEKSN